MSNWPYFLRDLPANGTKPVRFGTAVPFELSVFATARAIGGGSFGGKVNLWGSCRTPYDTTAIAAMKQRAERSRR
jgi:hypothetical protein